MNRYQRVMLRLLIAILKVVLRRAETAGDLTVPSAYETLGYAEEFERSEP